MDFSHRAGRYIQQPSDYKAFIPAPLPPAPLIACSGALQTLLSSQIEGTQSTLEVVLAFETEAVRDDTPKDVAEVVNCARAMNHGLQRLGTLSLSLRQLREIHGELMTGVRGGDKSPGEFRISQNWIGGSGRTLRDADLVPPPPLEVLAALGQLEVFLHSARAATQTAQAIVAVRDSHRSAVAKNAKALALPDHLPRLPTLSVKRVVQLLGCTAPTANKPVREMESRDWLRELTGCGRNRLWRYQPCVDLFHRDPLDALMQDSA